MFRVAVTFSGLMSLAFLLSTCTNPSGKYLPRPLADTIPIEVIPSTFNIPIHYSLSEFEAFLNEKIRSEFLEVILFPTNNKKDKVKVNMKKFGKIRLSVSGNDLRIEFPLEVTATILQSRVNFLTKGIKPVVTILNLTLYTPARLDSRWHLVTRFNLLKTEWIQEPVIRLAGIPINLTRKLEQVLEKNESNLTSMLDASVNQSVSLHKPVSKIWNDLQKPIVIHKKPPVAFLKFIPTHITGNIRMNSSALICYTSIKAVVAMINESKLRAPMVPLPAYKHQRNLKRYSEVNLYAFAELNSLNNTLREKLNGFRMQKDYQTLILKDPYLFVSDSGLTIDIKTIGSVEGHILATVQPYFDTISQRLHLKNFQFKVVTDSWLLNLGDAFLHDKLRDTLQTFLTLEADTLIRKIPDIIENAIASGRTGKTIEVKIDELKIHSCDIRMDARRIHFIINTTFASNLTLKRLNPGKEIMIKPKVKLKS